MDENEKEVNMGIRFLKRINANTGLFNGHFIDVKTFYVLKFNTIPCLTFISDMDVTKVFTHMTDRFNTVIEAVYQHCYFDHNEKKIFFNNTIFVLENKRMVELADNYCQILYQANDFAFANQLANDLANFRLEKNITPAFRHTPVVGFAREARMN